MTTHDPLPCGQYSQFQPQRLVARKLELQFFEPLPQTFQAPLAHGPLLGHARLTRHQHIEVLVLRQELDFHCLSRLVPGPSGQGFFKLSQAPLGRADELRDRASTPILQVLLGGDATIHEEDYGVPGHSAFRSGSGSPQGSWLEAVLPANTS
jgi:hypothetical protein